MLQGKRETAWDHTAALIATLRAVNGDKGARHQNPFRQSVDGSVMDRDQLKTFLKKGMH